MGLLASLIVFFCAANILRADVRLPALVSDHMALQRGVPVRIWGWADPGETVTVSFRGQSAAAATGSTGKWQVFLQPMAAGAAADMTIAGNQAITVHDVLVGEVWVASGQSNMEYGMARLHNIPAVQNSEAEIARAEYPQIRLFLAQETVADQPADDLRGRWQRCSPASVRPFSAVAYFFARELAETQRVPVGIIGSYWGGSPIQAWIRVPCLRSEAALQFIFDDWQKRLAGSAAPGTFESPGGLFNGMIAPITPFAIRGVIWYQGESDTSERRAYAYRRLFASLIEDWREAWGIGEFPFYFVQVSSCISNGWRPLLRESQTQTLKLRNTAMAVTIDIGNATYNHPANKQDVGHRLALPARSLVYGEKVTYSGPSFREMTIKGDRARVWFDHVGTRLAIRGDGPLAGFEIAAADGKFVPAQAEIDEQTVLVSSPSVLQPAMVRYAWSDNPAAANLMNKDGLPASPFRSRPGPER